MLLPYVLSWAAGTALAFPHAQVPLQDVSEAQVYRDALLDSSSLCPQARPLIPTEGREVYDLMLHALHEDPAFQLRAFEALGKAIRVP